MCKLMMPGPGLFVTVNRSIVRKSSFAFIAKLLNVAHVYQFPSVPQDP